VLVYVISFRDLKNCSVGELTSPRTSPRINPPPVGRRIVQ